MVSKYEVLARLPAYRDEWELVVKKQYVEDIKQEILYCQKKFARYYDLFCDLFIRDSVGGIAQELYDFCEYNITYKEETVKMQSSALPTGILIRGFGDCKHYALMIGGVLGALNKVYNAGIKWCYYFAGYQQGDEEPYHVFVGVLDPESGEEIWIDPTPGAADKEPTLLIMEKVK